MPAPTFSSFLRRHFWKIAVVVSAAAAVYALTLPLVKLPGRDPVTFMEAGRIQGQVLRALVIASGLATLLRLRHPAGIFAGLAMGLAGGVACGLYEEWRKLQDQPLQAQSLAEATPAAAPASTLEYAILHGAWILGISLALLLLATLITRPRPARRQNIHVRTNPFMT